MTNVTGLFDRYEDAASAVRQLTALGIPRDDISIVANNSDNWYDDSATETGAEAGAGLGALAGGAGGLLTGLGLLAIPGVGPVVAAGWLVATAAGAAAGAVVGGAAGGLIGALTDAGVEAEDAEIYAEGVRRGGTLVSAQVTDRDLPAARAILNKGGVDLVTRREQYRSEGWTSFDPNADTLPGTGRLDTLSGPTSRL